MVQTYQRRDGCSQQMDVANNSNEIPAELIRSAEAGNQEALAQAFDLYRSRFIRMVDLRMDPKLKGRVGASDVIQEAFLDLAKKHAKFAARDEPQKMSLFVWMRLVVAERLINIRRRHLETDKRDAAREISMEKKTFDGSSSGCLAGRLVDSFTSASNRAIRAEIQAELLKTLDDMKAMDREIITMRSFEGMSNVEVAQSLGLSENGASSRYVRAMTQLKQRLQRLPGFQA